MGKKIMHGKMSEKKFMQGKMQSLDFLDFQNFPGGGCLQTP